MIRYTSLGGSIGRINPAPWGYSVSSPRRVPEPVRELFAKVHFGGTTEIDWDPKIRKATVVPYWERRHI